MPTAPMHPAADLYRRLLLDMPLQRSLPQMLRLAVQRLAQRPGIALVRIWLLDANDIAAARPGLMVAPGDEPCLQLVASAGTPLASPGEDWSFLDGAFSRFRIGERKVGTIAATGAPIEVPEISRDAAWIARPEWVEREQVRCFSGQPLIWEGDVLGVMVVFSRTPFAADELQWLRMVANHAAMSLINARAFAEIETLRRRRELESDFLREEVAEQGGLGELVGRSDALSNVVRQIELVAPTDAAVLVSGESGTGKELVVREIHRRSARCERPLIKVNCASIPADLFESEFFGHVKGAFTGALRDRGGRFEAAHGGTLFLDEVGEIPLSLQGKLLRALQEGEFERVGEERTRRVDVRVVSATNRNLKKDVTAGLFREDLYYRLNVFPIEIPPLRDRREDVLPLAMLFLERSARRFGRSAPKVTREVLQRLEGYPWPGNVRELQNVIERAVIVSRGTRLRLELDARAAIEPEAARDESVQNPARVMTEAEIRSFERENLRAALQVCGGKIYGPDGAANLLGMPPTTLSARIRSMGLRRRDS